MRQRHFVLVWLRKCEVSVIRLGERVLSNKDVRGCRREERLSRLLRI
jgi:hypothetical protein